MGQKKPAGLIKRGPQGIWHVEKRVRGIRLRFSTRTSNLRDASDQLARAIDAIRVQQVYGVKPDTIFRDAGVRYVKENRHLTAIRDHITTLEALDPLIGDLPLKQVHMGALEPYVEQRRDIDGVTNRTINAGLEVVRRILNLAAREWRDSDGDPLLSTSPAIKMLSTKNQRKPHPITWAEQSRLLAAVPDYLARMILFKVNTGTREQEVCQLQWDWWRDDPGRFVIPAEQVKNRTDRVVVLNSIAAGVIEQVRTDHPVYVFVSSSKPLSRMHVTSFRKGREAAGLPDVRIHDLKHSFGRRLRAAGVSKEDRKFLLGHVNGDITTHYSEPELEAMVEAAEKVCQRPAARIRTIAK